MIKNGRPYTNENGVVDDELFTQISEEEQKAVLQWIHDKLTPANEVYVHYSSYGLKHFCEQDTRIYLTNNQFKDAMMMAGYDPDEASELNWYYYISDESPVFTGISHEKQKIRQAGFIGWTKKFVEEDSYQGVFARELCRDKNFPVSNDYRECRRYMGRCCNSALAAFDDCWEGWERAQADEEDLQFDSEREYESC